MIAKTFHDVCKKLAPDTKMYVEVCGVQLELTDFRIEPNGGAVIFTADEHTEQVKNQRQGEYDHGEHRKTRQTDKGLQ